MTFLENIKEIRAMELEEENKKRKQESEVNIPIWKKSGMNYIHPEKKLKWEKTCEICAHSNFYGMEIVSALQIMKQLQNKVSIIKIKKLLQQKGYISLVNQKALCIVLEFARNGPELYSSVEVSQEELVLQMIQKQEQFNKMLDSGMSYKKASNELKECECFSLNLFLLPNDHDMLGVKNSFSGTMLLHTDGTLEGVLKEDVDCLQETGIVTGYITKNSVDFVITFEDNKQIACSSIKSKNPLMGEYEISEDNTSIYKSFFEANLKNVDKDFKEEMDLNASIEIWKRILSHRRLEYNLKKTKNI